MPQWKNEEQCFQKAVMADLYYRDGNGNEKKAPSRPYPREKPILQRKYEEWLTAVSDPLTGEFHKPRG